MVAASSIGSIYPNLAAPIVGLWIMDKSLAKVICHLLFHFASCDEASKECDGELCPTPDLSVTTRSCMTTFVALDW